MKWKSILWRQKNPVQPIFVCKQCLCSKYLCKQSIQIIFETDNFFSYSISAYEFLQREIISVNIIEWSGSLWTFILVDGCSQSDSLGFNIHNSKFFPCNRSCASLFQFALTTLYDTIAAVWRSSSRYPLEHYLCPLSTSLRVKSQPTAIFQFSLFL